MLLKKEFRKYNEFHVILTRDKDVYLKLRERTTIAKNSNADIFISLHADFNKNRRTRGISLYTLSEKASDKEAEDLARRENRSDFLGNVDLTSESSEVTNILIDLTKRETLNQSSHLVNFLIKDIKNEMNLLKRAHRFAGFTVLKSLDIPSVLIEMGYLSNKEDSKLLVSNSYQKKITSNIVKAVKIILIGLKIITNYFYNMKKNLINVFYSIFDTFLFSLFFFTVFILLFFGKDLPSLDKLSSYNPRLVSKIYTANETFWRTIQMKIESL